MQLFVHVSAFDRNIPRRPKIGDTVFYHVKTDKNGKTKAVDAITEGIAAPEKPTAPPPTKQYKKCDSNNSWKFIALCTILLIGAGSAIYNRLQ